MAKTTCPVCGAPTEGTYDSDGDTWTYAPPALSDLERAVVNVAIRVVKEPGDIFANAHVMNVLKAAVDALLAARAQEATTSIASD